MENWDAITKLAKECHTKQAWEKLFERHGDAIASTSNSKPILDIFKALKNDTQSLQYEPSIWGRLISGCLASWNFELGCEIAQFAQKIPSAQITIPAAQAYLESGSPSTTRELANRALRLSNLSPIEKLQLEMLICSSYAEEGKHNKAIRMLNKIGSSVRNPELKTKDRAEFLMRMGRMQYFLGRYMQAGTHFYEASTLYKQNEEWEQAAVACFNTAACYENYGSRNQDMTFALVEECRRLSEAHNLAGPLSHCESFYGLHSYDHGNYAEAREHFRRALEFVPISDKSFRRLHILSMLANTYMKMGRYHLAKKFGQQTIDLAALDDSERFKSRFTTLEAELLWEAGMVEESQKLLSEATEPLEANGIFNLEELQTLTHYNNQSAKLGETQISTKFNVKDHLYKNTYAWLDRQCSLAQLHLNRNEFTKAEEIFKDCYKKSRQNNYRFHVAISQLGIIRSHLKQRSIKKLEPLIRDFEVSVARIGETPLKTQAQFVLAALSYQQGDFKEAERILRSEARKTKHSFTSQFVLNCTLATIEGKSPRLTADWQKALLARFIRTYFAPTLQAEDDRHFRVSNHYLVSLERHPSLAELLHYLLLKSNYSAQTSEIQIDVWKQSLQSQGWKQKIRNTVMRLRDFFPYTMAPIILHSDAISLYKEAIDIQAPRREGMRTEDEIVRLLTDSPMSSSQLSERLKISPATTKRILKRLAEVNEIHPIKKGRNVFYSASAP